MKSFRPLENEGDKMRKSSVPFGMNSPKTTNVNVGPSIRIGGSFSPNYDHLNKNSYIKIKDTCERSRVPFSPEERKIGLQHKFNISANSSYRSTFAWNTPKYYVNNANV